MKKYGWLFTFLSKLFDYAYRVFNKLNIRQFNNPLERAKINCLTHVFSDSKLSSVIRDKGHKLLQQALGQEIDNNKYFLSAMLEEAEKRKIDNETVNWAKNIYDDFLNSRLYKDRPRGDADDQHKIELNMEKLDNYLELASKRQSVRKFYPDPVPGDIVEKILRCGIEAPSSCNRQSWRFITFKNKADKEYVAGIRRLKFIEKAPLVILALVDTEVYNQKADRNITSVMDMSAAIMNILNACSVCGLGSCWINFKASVNMKDTKLLKQHFNIEKKYEPISIIVVGKPAQDISKPWRNKIREYWLADRQ